MRLKHLFLLAPFLVGFALAQDTTTSTAPDIAAWFASTATLATIVVAAVAFLKRHVLKTLDGLTTVLASLVVGGLLGLIGHWVGYLTDGLMPALGFGVSAGLIASGGWDAITGLLGKRRAAES